MYYVHKLWYNLFNILEPLRRGWTIGNKGMHIILSKGHQRIEFDRLFKCPTGHLNGVTIKAIDDIGTIASLSQNNKNTKISYEEGHMKLMRANDESVKRTAHKLEWKLEQRGHKSPCISCAIEKTKYKKVPKTTQVK